MDRPKVISSGSSRVGRRADMRPDLSPLVILLHTDPSLTAPKKPPPKFFSLVEHFPLVQLKFEGKTQRLSFLSLSTSPDPFRAFNRLD